MQKITKVVAFWALAILLFACNEEEIVTMNQETGKLIVGGVEVSAIVGDMQSRATLENVPSGNKFTITVKSEDGSFERTLEEGVFSCILPVGTYTVEAAYGEDKIATDKPYFYGSASVEIKEGMTESISVTASLQSAIIRAVMDEELLAQYEDYTLWISKVGSSDMESIDNDKDIFVPAGDDYLLRLTGTNLLGDDVNTSWELKSLSPKTRYIVSCDADLPSFTFPEQAITNAWSKFIYITPMTAENMTSHPEMAQQVMDNIVYEASADNGSTWIPAEYDSENEKWVIKGLQSSTAYTLRSRFGGVVSSNTQEITTENAQELENGSMDTWSNDPYTTYGQKTIYRYYAGTSSTDRSWGTRNTLTMDGVRDGNSAWFNNQRTAYRWNSCTIPTSDAVSGQAAEIRTMALANFAINSGTVGAFGSHSSMPGNVLANANVFVGWLYTGTTDVTTTGDPDMHGIAYTARPLSFSFDYKYAPYNTDNFVVSAALYDANYNRIAYIDDFKSSVVQNSYTTLSLDFIYETEDVKAAYLFVMFKSGENSTVNDVQHIDGSYDANPWSLDTFVGSVLKIDNVKLNYDYE